MTYRLTIATPYEGDYSEDFTTEEELIKRIKEQLYSNYGSYSMDDMDVTKIEYVDIYELMKK